MKKLILPLVLVLMVSCKKKPQQMEKNGELEVLPTMKKEKEWTVLFDGTSFDGWHIYPEKKVPDAWVLEDGAMLLKTSVVREDGERFNMVTDKEYTNFVLSLEWMVQEGANSGVMWGVQEGNDHAEPYFTGPEIQVLDNTSHPDANNGTSHRAGALYDMISPSKDVVKPVGSWNHYLISINHKTNQGSVVLNGVLIGEFPVHGADWDAMVAKSKFASWPDFGKYKTGKIALQDHGEPIVIGYRNIKIKTL